MMMRVKCDVCDQTYLVRNPTPIGRQAAAHFHLPAESFVCFWCVFGEDDHAMSSFEGEEVRPG